MESFQAKRENAGKYLRLVLNMIFMAQIYVLALRHESIKFKQYLTKITNLQKDLMLEVSFIIEQEYAAKVVAEMLRKDLRWDSKQVFDLRGIEMDLKVTQELDDFKQKYED